MIRLVLLLLGADFVRRHGPLLAVMGVLWGAIGVGLFIDALDGVLVFPLTLFGWLLLIESLATLFLAASGLGAQRTLRYVKGGLFLLISLLIVSRQPVSNMLLAMLFGTAFALGGVLQVISTWLVRFPRWRWSVAGGLLQIAIAVFLIQPYPTHYAGTVVYCLGLGLMFSGWSMLWLAARSRRLTGGSSISGMSLRNARSDRPLDAGQYATAHPGDPAALLPGLGTAPQPPGAALTVHVWTPSGSARSPTRSRPVVDRYIAAVDAHGVISTGHAALEVGQGLYISLYPAQEIDRSPGAFARVLRATADNDVPARYLTDYPSEAKSWCESTEKVVFRDYDLARLQRFWQGYRREAVYNLTHRNCSSTVAHALEAALEGTVGRRTGGWSAFFRTLMTPEVWVAGQIHKRATTMAWTPGLALDYARALRAVVHPRRLSWIASLQLAIRQSQRWRRADRLRRAEAAGGSPALD